MRNTIKQFIKRCIQRTSARLGRHTRKASEPELIILMYHRVLPSDDKRALIEEPGMMVTPETLRTHLETVQKFFEILNLSDWVERQNSNKPLPLRTCAITFDDGWADNYEFAFPILKEMRIPSTMYLTAELIGTNQTFWPERLSRTLSLIAKDHSEKWNDPTLDWINEVKTCPDFSLKLPTQEHLADIINHAKRFPDTDIHARIDKIERKLKLPNTNNLKEASLLTWEQIHEMIQSGLVEVGSHTCHHIRLHESTPFETMRHEIIKSKTIIEHKTGQPIDSFCFPNGDYSEQSLELVKANYQFALSTRSGWNTICTDKYLLKRIAIHQGNSYDQTAFLSRVSGWI